MPSNRKPKKPEKKEPKKPEEKINRADRFVDHDLSFMKVTTQDGEVLGGEESKKSS